MSDNDTFTVRTYSDDDFDLVQGWWLHHTPNLPLSSLVLPPVGVVVEDGKGPVFACFCHLSLGIGIGFLECPVSRPGASVRLARDAFGHALGAIEEVCRTMDYTLLLANGVQGVKSTLEGLGFTHDRTPPKFTMIKNLNNQPATNS